MVCKNFIKLLLEIISSLKLILINTLFFSIIFLNNQSVFSDVIRIERNLALKYCDSIESNLFEGLDNERILKYEYFFNSVEREAINEESVNIKNFASEVEYICSYRLDNEELSDFQLLLNIFHQK
tara:strand:+ start:18 stop:392 length:375 start_codon:yes stop_codon:yes gene_type:complete